MIKKIGTSLILLALLFNYNKVKAEDYQVGDLVELINPEGGESQKFYIIHKDENSKEYYLLSKEPEFTSISAKEFNSNTIESNKNFKYIYEIEKNNTSIKSQDLSFILGEVPLLFNCKLNNDTSNNSEEKYYLDCPNFYNNFTNSIVFENFGEQDKITKFETEDVAVIFEKSDIEKYDFMITIYNELTDNQKKVDIFLWLGLEEQNLDLIRKVEDDTEPETNIEENTNTIIENNNKDNNEIKETQTKEENIENPKTSDLIIWIPLSLLIICSIATIVYIEKKYSKKL